MHAVFVNSWCVVENFQRFIPPWTSLDCARMIYVEICHAFRGLDKICCSAYLPHPLNKNRTPTLFSNLLLAEIMKYYSRFICDYRFSAEGERDFWKSLSRSMTLGILLVFSSRV
uniref:Uncharacterized protein n=1 Tax=Physcomitrium patens TaxID=3218 RepID=A0A2K1ICX3_PHYPA|nr:hypothetical protein PHYPA_030602 [Physcomitrium patens]